jgi:endonuclease-3
MTAATPGRPRGRRAPAPDVARALDLLRRTFGRPRRTRRLPALDELVLTVLSQNTSDTNRDRAWASFRRRFPTWGEAADAPVRSIAAAIRAGGLAGIKSRVIRDILRRVRAERGGYDLEFLRRLPPARARDWLLSFRGVGDKTAACVLLFSCGRAVFPVDTHIHRVSRRLGWIPAGASAAEAHALLGAMIPGRRHFEAHVNLITLGRRLCRPRRPRCDACPLRDGCPAARRAPG